ncbi:MAG TPA: hypothetical protein DEO39_06020 [Clostridiales bacterium]|nr:hypothetical protein [Clostridiales bacterium]
MHSGERKGKRDPSYREARGAPDAPSAVVPSLRYKSTGKDRPAPVKNAGKCLILPSEVQYGSGSGGSVLRIYE